MANRVCQYKYTVSMVYLDQVRNKSKTIKTESIKFIVIDHNYLKNSMPIVYVNLRLDKKLLDDMKLNCNKNLIVLAINKYDNLTNEKQEIECFRKKFIYFIPNDANTNDPIDYNDATTDEHLGNTYESVQIGLMCLDHINNNKKNFKFSMQNVTISEPVKQVMDHFPNTIIETIGDPTVLKQLTVPQKDSVRQMLNSLNDIRVFYNTPYIYYQDFTNTYLISSSGKAIPKQGELYSSVIFEIEDVTSKRANEIGVINNKSSQTYQIPVNYVNTDIYDNTIANKSQTELIGMTSSGASSAKLKNQASYSKNKTSTIRLNNDNEGMLDNIKAQKDMDSFMIAIQKMDIDTDVLSLNKRITIHNIDRYKEHNGDYLMFRKQEMYLREDSNFIMSTKVCLKEIPK